MPRRSTTATEVNFKLQTYTTKVFGPILCTLCQFCGVQPHRYCKNSGLAQLQACCECVHLQQAAICLQNILGGLLDRTRCHRAEEQIPGLGRRPGTDKLGRS